MTKVIAINGSPRKKGNTSILIGLAFEEFKTAGFQTELINIGEEAYIGCQACYTCKKTKDNSCKYTKDSFNKVFGKCLEADVIILGSPVYVGSMTASMKAFIDRACIVNRANGQALKRKIGTSIVAVRRNGALTTFNSLNNFFTISQMIIVSSSYWNQGIGREKGEVMEDEEGKKTIRILAENIIWAANKLSAPDPAPKLKKIKKS